MARILVTGGAGYIGSHTRYFLEKSGHSVSVVDDLSRGFPQAVPAGALHAIDTRDTKKLSALLRQERIEAVIHFAAYISVGESTERPELYFSNNVWRLAFAFRSDARGRCKMSGVFLDGGRLRDPRQSSRFRKMSPMRPSIPMVNPR